MPVDTAVFDIGGVLVDWDPRYLYRKMFDDPAEMEHFLATVCTTAWNAELDRGRAFEDGVAQLLAAHPDRADEIVAYHQRWDEMVNGAVEGTVAVLDELRSRGVPFYGLTNFAAEKLAVLEERLPFLDWFEGVVISSEEGVVKPDRVIYERLCTRFGVVPHRSVFVDDSPANTAAARALGFVTIDFRSPAQLRHELGLTGLLG